MTGRDFLEDAATLLEGYGESVKADFEKIPPPRVWERPVPGQVSPANLVLHLTGNLRHFFGHLLGDSGFQRDRDREFVEEPWADAGTIARGWESAAQETAAVLRGLEEKSLDRPAPVETYPGGVPVRMYVLRLLAHLAYHSGQIRSHARIMGRVDD